MAKTGFTYILANKNRTVLYCGETSNLEKRLWEGKIKMIESNNPDWKDLS
jgi:predicted GIY-YIG superfamily endonuclease